jgi:hypothetical protein
MEDIQLLAAFAQNAFDGEPYYWLIQQSLHHAVEE